jgi:hypothetical protein
MNGVSGPQRRVLSTTDRAKMTCGVFIVILSASNGPYYMLWEGAAIAGLCSFEHLHITGTFPHVRPRLREATTRSKATGFPFSGGETTPTKTMGLDDRDWRTARASGLANGASAVVVVPTVKKMVQSRARFPNLHCCPASIIDGKPLASAISHRKLPPNAVREHLAAIASHTRRWGACGATSQRPTIITL